MKIQRSEHLSVERPDCGIETEIKQKEEQRITELLGGGKISPREKRWTESDQTELATRPTGTPSVHLH